MNRERDQYYIHINPQLSGIQKNEANFPVDFPGCDNPDDIVISLRNDGWLDVVTATGLTTEDEFVNKIAPQVIEYEDGLEKEVTFSMQNIRCELEKQSAVLKRQYKRQCLLHGNASNEAGAADKRLCAMQEVLDLLADIT